MEETTCLEPQTKHPGREKCPWWAFRQQESSQTWPLRLQSHAERRRLRRKNISIQGASRVRALGGDPSPQEQTIIGDSVKNMLYIASLDNYLMQLKSLVRKGRPHPILATRTQLAAHLRENLKTLGLHRRMKNVSLTDLLTKDDESANGNGAEKENNEQAQS
jgi:hypothetical protein